MRLSQFHLNTSKETPADADQATRAAIATPLGRTDNLRFVAFGGNASVNPDPGSPRLSIMLDAQNIIRDARCG